MRIRSLIAGLIIILLVAAGLFYFYGYRNRAISADIQSVRDTTADAATTTAVKTALALNKDVSAFDIHVATTNGNVTLTGQVPTDENKKTAEDLVRSTKGVTDVTNSLQVDPNISAAAMEKQHMMDVEIKAAVLEGILNNPSLKTQQIKVDVMNSDVKLTGNVQTADEKSNAETLARQIPNVHNVDSGALTVTNTAPAQPAQNVTQLTDDQLSMQVESALMRDGSISQPQKIKVSTRSGIVYLSGAVDTKAEKSLAAQIARGVSGTKDVVNNLETSTRK
jgi:hyperosmotically inducible protein